MEEDFTQRTVAWREYVDGFEPGREYVDTFDPHHKCVDQIVLPMVLGWRPGGKGLGLCSAESGCAKTRMMFQLIRDLHFAGHRWEAISDSELAHMYGTTFEDRYECEEKLKRLCRVPVFFLDDLGKARKATEIDAIGERLFDIVNRRYAARLPILWTSNKTSSELTKRLGDRGEFIMRRLFEMCDVCEVKKSRKGKARKILEASSEAAQRRTA